MGRLVKSPWYIMVVGRTPVPETVVKPGFCHRCDQERPIHQTVSWQEDTCTYCGSTDVEITD